MAGASASVELSVLIKVIQDQQASFKKVMDDVKGMVSGVKAGATEAGSSLNAFNKFFEDVSTAAKNTGLAGGEVGDKIKDGADQGGKALQDLSKAFQQVAYYAKVAAGGFLAFQSVRFLKDLADVAARAQVLQTVLHVVALNAGITAEEIDKVDTQIQRLGITAASSRESLTQFLQARLDLKFAPQLARAAQDLAVISGKNSSETFARLITNIQQLDTLGLRWMGIIADRQQAEEKYKLAIGASTRELTKREKQAALMTEVLEKAQQLEGTYSNAMNDVGKQITSLDRLTTTYRQTLGNSLLPAYSVIISKVSTMFEKLILLAQEFSSNGERAQALADVMGGLVQVASDFAVFLMEHLDTIITLVKWYAELRIALAVWSGLATALTWITAMVEGVLKLRLAFQAWQTGTVTMQVALKALGATSVTAAAEIIKVATAQTALAASATPATAGLASTGAAAVATNTAVSALVLTWGTLAAVLAIPVVGYIIYKIKADIEEAAKTPTLQKAAAAQRNITAGINPSDNQLILEVYFKKWKEEHPDFVADLKTDVELWKEFNKQVKQTIGLADNSSIAKELGEAKAELTAAQTARQQLRNPTIEGEGPLQKPQLGEVLAATQRVEEAGKKVNDLIKKMNEAFKFDPSSVSTKEIFAHIKTAEDLQRKLGAVRADPKAGRNEKAQAEAALEVEKAQVKAMLAKHEEALKKDTKLSPEARADELAAAQYKAELTGLADSQTALIDAQKQLFGQKLSFTPEGVTTGAFGAALSGYNTLLTEAKKILDTDGKIPKQLADQLKFGLEELGRAAKQPLDLTNLKNLGPQIKEFEKVAPGVTGKLSQAVGVAEIGVRNERFQFGQPIVQDKLTRVKQANDAELAEEQRKQARLKTLLAGQAEDQETRYKQGLVGLNEYYNARMDRVRREGAAEAEVQAQVIIGLRAQQAVAGQTAEAYAAREVEIKRAESQLKAIHGQTELALDREKNAREDRQRNLEKEAKGGALGIVAGKGGEAEALKQLDFQLEQDRKKFGELSDTTARTQAEEFIRLKQIVDEAEIYRKTREQGYQVELNIERELMSQLDLEQKGRDAAASRDKSSVAKGDMPEYVAMLRSNERIQEDMFANRLRRESKERDLIVLRRKFDTETQKLQEELARPELGLSKAEQTKQVIALQQQLTQEMTATEGAVMDLDKAYDDLAASSESYSQKIKTSFINGFSDALTQSITNFRSAGQTWLNFAKGIADEIVGIFTKALTQRLFKSLNFGFMDSLLGTKPSGGGGGGGFVGPQEAGAHAEGGIISGPGTGTSDSIPAYVSAGEHIMPAAKTATWGPLLEGIRLGKYDGLVNGRGYVHGGIVGELHSIAIPHLIPRHYASGGVVVSDGGASTVTPASGGGGNMMVQLHPEAMNMTMREWLESEVARQQTRR